MERILELFDALRRGRPELTSIVVTHDPRAAATAHRIIRMRDGRVDSTAAPLGAD